jgi:hypothetical protein
LRVEFIHNLWLTISILLALRDKYAKALLAEGRLIVVVQETGNYYSSLKV